MTEEQKVRLERAMISAAKELLGPGFVPDYYEQAAAEFISIAQSFIKEVAKKGRG